MYTQKRTGILALLLAFALILAGCGAAPDSKEEVQAGYQKLTAAQAQEKIEEGGVTVVDVRRAEEYAQGHIPGAILVPNEEIASEPPQALPDTEATLLVYCRSGRRSREAAEKLIGLGYQNVYDFGGINDWPYEIVEGEAP